MTTEKVEQSLNEDELNYIAVSELCGQLLKRRMQEGVESEEFREVVADFLKIELQEQRVCPDKQPTTLVDGEQHLAFHTQRAGGEVKVDVERETNRNRSASLPNMPLRNTVKLPQISNAEFLVSNKPRSLCSTQHQPRATTDSNHNNSKIPSLRPATDAKRLLHKVSSTSWSYQCEGRTKCGVSRPRSHSVSADYFMPNSAIVGRARISPRRNSRRTLRAAPATHWQVKLHKRKHSNFY